MSELPPGFVLDQPMEAALPPGFVLDSGPSMGEDAANSVGAGLGNAAIGTLGMVGDARSLLSAGVDAAGSKLGFDPSMLKKAAGYAFPALNSAPTSQDIKTSVSDPIVSPDYEPKTGAGSFLKKGAEFIPNMLLGGPEGVGARLLTNVAAPAIGSQIGENIAGPLGGAAGGLIGAVAGPAAFNRAVRAMRPAPVEAALDDIRAASRANYQHPDVANVRINPDATEGLATIIERDLQHGGIGDLVVSIDGEEMPGQIEPVGRLDPIVAGKNVDEAIAVYISPQQSRLPRRRVERVDLLHRPVSAGCCRRFVEANLTVTLDHEKSAVAEQSGGQAVM